MLPTASKFCPSVWLINWVLSSNQANTKTLPPHQICLWHLLGISGPQPTYISEAPLQGRKAKHQGTFEPGVTGPCGACDWGK